VAVWHFAWNKAAFDIFAGSGVIGTLILLVVYLMATVGAIRFIFFGSTKRAAGWEIMIPLLGIGMLGITIWENIHPWPSAPAAQALPIAAIIWLVVGVGFIFAKPALAQRMGEKLRQDENLSVER